MKIGKTIPAADHWQTVLQNIERGMQEFRKNQNRLKDAGDKKHYLMLMYVYININPIIRVGNHRII